MSPSVDKSLLIKVQELQERANALELRYADSLKGAVLPEAAIATDDFANSMVVRALGAGFRQIRFVRCPDDYYSWALERRRKYLGAPSVRHLMKSIVLENVRSENENDQWRYVCCVIPYAFKVDAELLKAGVRQCIEKRGENVPPSRAFNYRLVEDCTGVTGYEPNAVTPLGIATLMPVVVHNSVNTLQPTLFWLGGGEVSLKWKVMREEFLKVFKADVIPCAVKDE